MTVYGKKQSWLNSRYHPGIFLEELWEIAESLSQNSLSLG
jgi:hypothetical protein